MDTTNTAQALAQLVADDAYAMTFQTMGQYRSALIGQIATLAQPEPQGAELPSASNHVLAIQQAFQRIDDREQRAEVIKRELHAYALTTRAPGEPVACVRIDAGQVRIIPSEWREGYSPLKDGQPLYAGRAPAAVPEIDYDAAIAASAAHPSVKAGQGTTKCIAFVKGAEWFRQQCAGRAPAEGASD